ncbi:MAG: hypothetical protein U1G05_09405 [Kiritimatiellia bacterium]
MNISPEDRIEARLRRLTPARPPDALMERLLSTRPAPASRPRPPRGSWSRLVLRLAAALALLAGAAVWLRPRAPSAPAAEPPRTRSDLAAVRYDEILDARPAGIVRMPNGESCKVLECTGVRRLVMEDDDRDLRCEVEVPTRRVMLLAMDPI